MERYGKWNPGKVLYDKVSKGKKRYGQINKKYNLIYKIINANEEDIKSKICDISTAKKKHEFAGVFFLLLVSIPRK